MIRLRQGVATDLHSNAAAAAVMNVPTAVAARPASPHSSASQGTRACKLSLRHESLRMGRWSSMVLYLHFDSTASAPNIHTQDTSSLSSTAPAPSTPSASSPRMSAQSLGIRRHPSPSMAAGPSSARPAGPSSLRYAISRSSSPSTSTDPHTNGRSGEDGQAGWSGDGEAGGSASRDEQTFAPAVSVAGDETLTPLERELRRLCGPEPIEGVEDWGLPPEPEGEVDPALEVRRRLRLTKGGLPSECPEQGSCLSICRADFVPLPASARLCEPTRDP